MLDIFTSSLFTRQQKINLAICFLCIFIKVVFMFIGFVGLLINSAPMFSLWVLVPVLSVVAVFSLSRS